MSVFKGSVYKSTVFKATQGVTASLDVTLSDAVASAGATARRFVDASAAAADAGLVSTTIAKRVAALAATLDSILFTGQIGEGVQPGGGKKRRGGELRYPSRRWEAERELEEKKPDQPLPAAREAEARPIVPGATVPVKRRFTQRATDLRDLGKLLGLSSDALERARRARELDEDDEDVLMLLG